MTRRGGECSLHMDCILNIHQENSLQNSQICDYHREGKNQEDEGQTCNSLARSCPEGTGLLNYILIFVTESCRCQEAMTLTLLSVLPTTIQVMEADILTLISLSLKRKSGSELSGGSQCKQMKMSAAALELHTISLFPSATKVEPGALSRKTETGSL